MREMIIAKQTGQAFKVNRGGRFSVIDIEGQQVADLFAVHANEWEEFFSAAVTIDCKESLHISTGDILYSNRYQPMMTIIEDDVGVHDLLIPSCRAETYQHFYNVGHHHSNCFDNINASLRQYGVPPFNSIQPLNIFMNTAVTPEQTIQIQPPVSQAGDKITFQAEMDLIICISACSITEGACNAGRSKPVLIQIW